MKKLLIASLILAASHSTFAADKKTTAKNDVFAKSNPTEVRFFEAHSKKCNALQIQEMLKLFTI